jgi:glutathione S-transferase
VFHTIDAAASQFPHAFALQEPRIPRLLALRKHVAEQPRIAAYLASERRGVFEGNSMM